MRRRHFYGTFSYNTIWLTEKRTLCRVSLSIIPDCLHQLYGYRVTVPPHTMTAKGEFAWVGGWMDGHSVCFIDWLWVSSLFPDINCFIWKGLGLFIIIVMSMRKLLSKFITKIILGELLLSKNRLSILKERCKYYGMPFIMQILFCWMAPVKLSVHRNIRTLGWLGCSPRPLFWYTRVWTSSLASSLLFYAGSGAI